MAKHFAIVANENGEPVRFPFKSWVRENMEELPEDFLRNATTRQFRDKLLQQGWVKEEGSDTVVMIKPDTNGSVEYANNYIQVLDVEEEEHEDEAEEAQEITFGLERDMQRALRQNIQWLEQGLQIVDGGRERHTEAGFIDITAEDVQGRKVIIELKAPVAKPEVIAQTLAYMQAVSVVDNVDVRGIIVASDFVDRVKLAARQIPNLKLVTYAFQFNFNEVE